MSAFNEVLTLFTGNASSIVRAGRQAEGAIAGVQGTAEEANTSFLGFMATVAKVGAVVTAASVVVGAVAVKMAMTFQQQVELIQTQAGDTKDSIQTLTSTFLAMASQVGQSPTDLATAFYHLASSGYQGAQAFDILRNSAQLAAVGQANLEDTVNAVTYVLQSGIPGVKNAADAVSQLNAIVGSGNMRLEDFATAMSSGVLGAAAAYGVSLQSLGAAFVYLTDRGTQASEASTRLRMTIALLGAPTAKSATILKDLGLSTNQAKEAQSAMWKVLEAAGVSVTNLSDDMKKPDGILVALEDLKTHMTNAGLTASQQAAVITRAFGGARSGAAIQSLANNLLAVYQTVGNSVSVQQKYNQIGKQTADFQKDWAAQQTTLNQKLNEAKAAIEAVAIRLGLVLMPYAQDLVGWLGTTIPPLIANFTDWLQTNAAAIQRVASAIGTDLVSALSILGGVVTKVGGFFVQYLLPGLTAIADFVQQHHKGIEDIAALLAGMWVVKKVGGTAASWVADAISNLGRLKTYIVSDLGGALSNLLKGNVFSAIASLFGKGSTGASLAGAGGGLVDKALGMRVYWVTPMPVTGLGGPGGGPGENPTTQEPTYGPNGEPLPPVIGEPLPPITAAPVAAGAGAAADSTGALAAVGGMAGIASIGVAVAGGLGVMGAIYGIVAAIDPQALMTKYNPTAAPGQRQSLSGYNAVFADLTTKDPYARGGKAGVVNSLRSESIQQDIIANLTKQGVTSGEMSAAMTAIDKAMQNGKIKTPSDLEKFVESWKIAATHSGTTATAAMTIAPTLFDLGQSQTKNGIVWKMYNKDILTQLGQSLVAHTNLAEAAANLQLLYNDHVIKTQPQLSNIEGYMNDVQSHTHDADQAQGTLASLLAAGKITTKAQVDQFIKQWNDTLANNGGIPPTLKQIEAELVTAHGSAVDIAKAFGDIDTTVSGWQNAIVAANIPALTKQFGQDEAGASQAIRSIRGLIQGYGGNEPPPPATTPKKPTKAVGGEVMPNTWYTVGEHGTELFRSGSGGGRIYSHTQAMDKVAEPNNGGSSVVHVYNPSANVDVVQALEEQRWLERAAVRNINPGTRFGLIGERT